MSSFQVINPFTNEVDRNYPLHSFDQAQQCIKQAHQEQRQWAKLTLAQRTKLVRKGLEYFDNHRA